MSGVIALQIIGGEEEASKKEDMEHMNRFWVNCTIATRSLRKEIN